MHDTDRERPETDLPGVVMPAMLGSLAAGVAVSLLLMGLVLLISPAPAHAGLASGGAVIPAGVL